MNGKTDKKKGVLEINIVGKHNNTYLSPENYDIKDIMYILENVENLLNPDKNKNRPRIAYTIEEGSVKHKFIAERFVIATVLSMINIIKRQNNINSLQSIYAQVIENIQKMAKDKECEINIKAAPTINDSAELKITKDTKYIRDAIIWINGEFYFYGKVTNAGGKEKANIHLNTEDYGTIIIKTPMSFLMECKENILYKDLGIRATGEQRLDNGEINLSSLEFKEFIDYNPVYDEKYLEKLRKNAESWIPDIDAVNYLNEIRGRLVNA